MNEGQYLATPPDLSDGATRKPLLDIKGRVQAVLAAGAALIGKINITGAAKGATTALDVTATAQGADHNGLDVQLRDASGNTISPALDATLTGGTAKAIVRGGAKGATTAADVTSTANGADHQGLDVVEQYAPFYEDATNGVAATTDKLIAVSTYAPSLSSDFGSATKANAKAAPGNILGIVGTNANAAGRWFQIHDKATAPAGTNVPKYSFWVASGGNIVIGKDFFVGSGGYCSTGIGWAWSTTAGTFTDSATASDHTTHVHYK